MKKSTDRILNIILTLAVAALFSFAAASGVLSAPDGTVSDRFYQEQSAGQADIAIVGIDDRAFQELGPWPWSRNIMAEAVRTLNSGGPDLRPAAIGIDVLFVGPGPDPAADENLARACGEGGNVITAGSAVFGSELVTEGDVFYMADRRVQNWEEPYPELAAASTVAHINTMEDEDAVLRHGLLQIDVPGTGEVPSLSRAVYERWCSASGIAPNPAPEAPEGFFYIPFTKEPGGYSDGISIADVLDGSGPPEAGSHCYSAGYGYREGTAV